jgi:hypothetical protein
MLLTVARMVGRRRSWPHRLLEMMLISLLAGSVDAKTGKPPKPIHKLLQSSLFGCLALDAVAGRVHDATRF